MINFPTIKSLTIPEGNVTKIFDASGNVLWSANRPVILTVEKITANTYAVETTYENEVFILLDIYPKTNGTVSVTYGGLTKTITDTSGAETPNALQVSFGTIYGVSDEVETPESGTLTIEGDYLGFGSGLYYSDSKLLVPSYAKVITSVVDWGNTKYIPAYAFYDCSSLTSITIPDSVTNIGDDAFYGCSSLTSITIPDGVTSIGHAAFWGCSSLAEIIFHEGLSTIGANAFYISDSVDSTATIQWLPVDRDIVLPSTLTTLGVDAFACYRSVPSMSGSGRYNWGVRSVSILAETPPAMALGSNVRGAFGNSLSCDSNGNIIEQKITVPTGCGDAYKAADGWSVYADYIVEAT